MNFRNNFKRLLYIICMCSLSTEVYWYLKKIRNIYKNKNITGYCLALIFIKTGEGLKSFLLSVKSVTLRVADIIINLKGYFHVKN